MGGGGGGGGNRAWYSLIVHVLKCPAYIIISSIYHYYYVRIMGVVDRFQRSLVHSCFERRAAPAIYKGRDVFVCVSPQVVS